MSTPFDAMMQDLRQKFEAARLEIQFRAERALLDIREQAEAHLQGLSTNRGVPPPAMSPPDPTPSGIVLEQKTTVLEHALERAGDMVGYPYKYGGGDWNGPTVGIVKGEQIPGFDCSGLVVYAYGDTEFDIPRTTEAQFRTFQLVAPEHVAPGVLAYTSFDNNGNPGHVSIITDEPNQCLEAGDPVGFYNFSDRGRVEYRIPRI